MNVINRRFLEALHQALLWKHTDWIEDMDEDEWKRLFELAEQHHVLPMIYEAVYDCAAAKQMPSSMLQYYKQWTIRRVAMQTMKTNEFLKLYIYLCERGLQPIIVKGLICRNLYPHPDYRMSSDEDIYIPESQYEQYHQALLEYGMYTDSSKQERAASYEVPYYKQNSLLYIELHKTLFPSQSDAYGDFNELFKDSYKYSIELKVNGIDVRTMSHTDHLLYLICHAFKHFLHSGFGLRQVCDIILYANHFGNEIDWKYIVKKCRKIRADLFTVAIFEIGQKYLGFDRDRAGYPKEWQQIQIDEKPLLEDLLDSGVYGDASMSRKHSSNMTLEAVSSSKQGKVVSSSVLKSVFPSIDYMKKRYTYLEKCSWMLPIAWGQRLVEYYKETKHNESNKVTESLEIGAKRIELLKIYKIIG